MVVKMKRRPAARSGWRTISASSRFVNFENTTVKNDKRRAGQMRLGISGSGCLDAINIFLALLELAGMRRSND